MIRTLVTTPQDRTVREGFAAIVIALGDMPGVMKPEAPANRRFDSSALRIDGRILAMVSRGRLVLKLPPGRVAELPGSGAGHTYDAGKGRPMTQWVSLEPERQASWLDLASEALAFVGAAS